MKIAHLSDIHLSRRQPENAAMLRLILQHIDVHHPDAEIVITGDIADTPTHQELEQAAEIIPDDAHVLPGNHDLYRWGFLRWWGLRRMWHEVMGLEDSWPKIADVDGGRIILLDSMMDVDLRRGSLARGYAGRDQLNALRMSLETNRPCAVFLHHHLDEQRTTLELVDADSLLAALAGGGARVACFGHLHQAGETSYEGVRLFASCKSVATMRYRVIEVGEKVRWWWEYV
ncbi:MAG: metallophosphoesterase family protein [Bradymonadaceae bacterium]